MLRFLQCKVNNLFWNFMTEYIISYEQLLLSFRKRTEYISGKRASTTSGYYRHAATQADMAIAGELALLACAVVATGLGKGCRNFKFQSDRVLFSLSIAESELEVSSLLQEALLCHMLCRWCLLTGLEDYEAWKLRGEETTENLSRRLQRGRPLFRRQIPSM